MSGGSGAHHSSISGIPGFGTFKPDSAWQRAIASNAGLYTYPHSGSGSGISETQFANIVRADDPKSACNPLLIEEFRCLKRNGFGTDNGRAATKCVKWYNEWMQCKWDEEKMRFGYNYLEDLPARKHKAYIAAPDFQYS
ncbi:hypothetical protein BBOV_III001940 [Babesia bovis T2Bo]|uniref:Uncharacterized protein n=1 Tax=Babesia bovis TaxID=5865 RepID=A7AMH7_BABBO|nr:hypothetical protein BBOV_III001940 [Babesia bovis T2Bo]EDO07761.1 hypothetical protein BBOV_III001940 [Babesia bovis T2Bo]|eukprot:XP_001611329.1 hypothetical protein [Babesia bovis T2Bo]